MKETTDSSISAQAKASTRSKALVRNPVEVQSKNLYLLLWWKELSSITNVSGKPQLAWDQASDYGDNRNRSRNWQTGAENTNSLDQERNSGIETEKHSAQGNTWAFQSVCLPMQEIWDMGSIPGLGRFPGGGHGNTLQYSCPENSMDRGAWRATVHGVAKSWIWMKLLSTSCCCC